MLIQLPASRSIKNQIVPSETADCEREYHIRVTNVKKETSISRGGMARTCALRQSKGSTGGWSLCDGDGARDGTQTSCIRLRPARFNGESGRSGRRLGLYATDSIPRWPEQAGEQPPGTSPALPQRSRGLRAFPVGYQPLTHGSGLLVLPSESAENRCFQRAIPRPAE